ncbi:MAG: tRNA 2-thiouridine(34) synthase MnmA [Patescibacteria group bacterium]|jgi:tRNA-specific 2-thiouridylase
MMKKKEKVMVAMSGGIDSSVAAALLKKQGFDVVGVFMRFWSESASGAGCAMNKCCSFEAYSDARRVAQKLGIPIYTLNMKVPFKKLVVDYFLKEYRAGRTPNPCVECNRFIKFGELLKKARAMGAEYVATGHYARVINGKLLKGKDPEKDQSYFLYTLTQDKLKQILFPVGDYVKPRVRAMAKKFGLPVHAKKDSQEVCFVGASLKSFLKKYLKVKSGKIVELESGKKLGGHDGLPFYTIGQRRGLALGGGPWYVVKIDTGKNVLYVSRDQKKLLSKELIAGRVSWIAGHAPKLPMRAKAKIRYKHKEAPCVIKKIKNNFKIIFDKPQRAITAGQSVVFYKGDEVLGGGVIK